LLVKKGLSVEQPEEWRAIVASVQISHSAKLNCQWITLLAVKVQTGASIFIVFKLT
jgi:hypothetical protein